MLSPNSLSEPTPWANEELNASVFKRFQLIARQYALRPAIYSNNDQTVSYKALYEQCLTLAAGLHSLTEKAEQTEGGPGLLQPGRRPVAILLPPGAAIISTMLAVIRLGRPYLTLDPNHPRERILAIIHHAGCRLVVCEEDEPLREDIQVVCQTVSLNDLMSAAKASYALPPEPQATDNAYILYTSGSTGTPKGVYQDQRGLLHDVMQYSRAIGISSLDCFSGFYSPSVNGAIRDIWAALLNGAALVPASPQTIGFVGMASLVSDFKITVFHAIPPLLRAFLASQPNPEALSSVRLCYIAGDKFFAKEVNLLFRSFPDNAQIYTGIGSTECATLYRHWLLDKQTPLSTTLLPAGYAIEDRNTRLVKQETLTDASDVMPGEVGFVQVESAYLARGYWQNPELTKTAFVNVEGERETRRFMPGDCFRELPGGLFEYVGRADSQVKVRGHRIDVADLEAFSREWLNKHKNAQHPDVCKVFALARKSQAGIDDSPSLIWVLAADLLASPPLQVSNVIVPALKQALANAYSAAAQPVAVLVRETLPRLPNYKLDIAELKRWAEVKLYSEQAVRVPVEGQFEDVVTAFNAQPQHTDWLTVMLWQWCTFFGVTPTNGMASHDWETVRADSLAIMNFFAELDNRLGIRIDYQNIALPFSLKGLYVHIAEHYQPQVERISIDKNLIVVPPFVGLAGLGEFDHLLDPEIRITKVPTTALYNPIGEMQPQLSDVVDKLMNYITHLGISGPLYFYGISSGAKPAFFAATQLQKAGADVRTIFIGDAGPHGLAQHFGAERLRAFSWLTKDIPKINATAIEVVAMKHRPNPQSPANTDEWKDYGMLGWHQYAANIGFVTTPHDHVACLTDRRVMEAINAEIMSNVSQQVERVGVDSHNVEIVKRHAQRLFLSNEAQQLADAVCWFELLFVLKPELKSIYQFNGPYSRLRAINRLNWQRD